MTRRAAALALAGALLSGWAIGSAGPANAHQRADLEITAPAEGASAGSVVKVVVVASSGAALAEAEFTLTLDERPVANDGSVGSGSVFTSFSLRAGDRLELALKDVAPGAHVLRLAYRADADDPREDVVRRFTVTGRGSPKPPSPTSAAPLPSASSDDSGGEESLTPVAVPLALVGVVVGVGALAVAAAMVVASRRRARAQSGE